MKKVSQPITINYSNITLIQMTKTIQITGIPVGASNNRLPQTSPKCQPEETPPKEGTNFGETTENWEKIAEVFWQKIQVTRYRSSLI